MWLVDKVDPLCQEPVTTVRYVDADGSQTGDGYRIEGPLPNGDCRRTSLSVRQEDVHIS
jgi:hypothetical protein